jgi:hypothetical protein
MVWTTEMLARKCRVTSDDRVNFLDVLRTLRNLQVEMVLGMTLVSIQM